MRLFELIGKESFEPQTKDVSLNRKFDPARAGTVDHKSLGHGIFSKVKKTTDPGEVKKTQFVRNIGTNRENDGFVIFANYVIKNQLWNKIHFPRIYVTKKFQDSEGKTRYQWKMERLEEFRSVDKEELYNLGKRYFHRYDLSKNAHTGQHANEISQEIHSAVSGNYFHNIKDETLEEALKIIRKLYEETRPGLDLHTGNMMIRRTSVGPQLVITDPFSSS